MTEQESVTYEVDSREPMSVGIVRAVAVLKNVDPIQLVPLYEAIDPEALDTLVESSAEPPRRIEFDYCGYRVIVRSGERVTVIDPPDDQEQ